MFKSVFAKYMTAVMAIFTVGFFILLVVVVSIVGNSVSHREAEELKHVGDAAADCVMAAVGECGAEQFAERLDAALDDPNGGAVGILTAMLTAGSDMDLFLADREGNLTHRVTHDSIFNVTDQRLDDSLTHFEDEDAHVSDVVRMEPYELPVLVSCRIIRAQSGEILGYVAVSSTMAPNGRVMLNLIKTVISSALLVLLAVMIALYFISERVTSPLREMSAAARNFANGKFDSRVRVHGNDEVAKLAVSFNNMADSLENLEKMRSSFVANVSHDLRTPMTTIAGFIDGIRDGVIPPAEQGQYLEIVSSEVHRLSRLVSSLLDLSRLQAGDRKLAPSAFDICEMARVILISFEKKIDEMGLEVEFDCARDRMMIHADYDAIYQVFYNICHNALKFSREGGLLRIRITEKNRRVTVAVYNEGQGIPTEDLPYVFERFYKTDKSRSLDKSGVGLGLFISKTVMDAHGERIWVESESGKNCEFFFTVPADPHALERGSH